MSKTVTLSYNGISADYQIGNTKRSCENRIEFLKGVFARNYVIREWINSEKLTKANFGPSIPGSIGVLDETTLSEDMLNCFNSEVETVEKNVNVTFNKAI